MFATTNDAAQSFPCIEREHVLAWFDFGFGDTLGRESLEIAGKLLTDWPKTARESASCFASSRLDLTVVLCEWTADKFAVASIMVTSHLKLGPVGRVTDWQGRLLTFKVAANGNQKRSAKLT